MSENPKKKIIMEWPVTVYRKMANESLSNNSFIRKIVDRMPQGFQDSVYSDDYHVTERIFERGFCFMQMGKNASKIKTILDVGCWSSDLALEFSCLGYQVYAIDGQEYHFTHPNFTFKKGDIREAPFEDEQFDLVTLISTVEHIGLGHYKEASEEEGDFKAMDEIHRILKPKGLLILTTPYGVAQQTDVFRVYDEARLTKLIAKFNVLEEQYRVNHKDKYWTVATKEETAKQGVNVRNRNDGNICLLLQKQ